jgi:tRNA (cytidine/uridine-2'-O-)-methyltransferase
MFNIVMVEPEIPHNTGAAGRLALATGSTLHLVRPLGFSLDDKQVRRVGLDYWHDVTLRVWDSFDDLLAAEVGGAGGRLHFLTTKASKPHWDVKFERGDFLVFGCETRGLPEGLLERFADRGLRIPMLEGATRSLNLSTAVAIVLYEGMRQLAQAESGC